MKRRAISLIIVLALCLSICPMRVQAAGGGDPAPSGSYKAPGNVSLEKTYEAVVVTLFDTRGYTYTITKQTAISVKSTGGVYLTTGTIESKSGAGIEVLSGGFLCVDQEDMTVIGTTYGLDIASGTTVKLSGGTFTGGDCAIRAAGGDYGALRVTGCAYFDAGGNPLLPEDVSRAKKVTVKQCTDHVYTYEANTDAPTHSRTCRYCGTTETAPCTFHFDENGFAECADCGHTLKIEVGITGGTYNGQPRPDEVTVAVTMDGSKSLTQNIHFTVDFTTGTNAGEVIAVTVTGKPYGWTFPKTFFVDRARPEIKWAEDVSDCGKEYDGGPIDEAALLGKVIITAPDPDYLKDHIQFSYRIQDSGAAFTAGLPSDVGAYEIIASLPELPNYFEAASSAIILTISKINPIKEAPVAVKPVYNRTEQELVTGGEVNPKAVGAVILFAPSEDGPWSPNVPTGTNAGDYIVYYKVEGTDNYDGVGPFLIDSVKIRRKEITPDVELEYTSHEYTGGALQPGVTVSDKADGTVLPVTEYAVEYSDNIKAGTATVTIKDKDNKGNYKIIETTAYFEITQADQAALTITNRPNKVVYGDVFTLETTGGSGGGKVTWKIIAVKDGNDEVVDDGAFDDFATVDAGGQVTVKGVGKITVQAEKTGADYKTITAEWTFTAGKRPVTATVTADSKAYDGKDTAVVHAAVEQGLAFNDTITITGPDGAELTGKFENTNAGMGKTVTVTGTVEVKVNGTIIVNNDSAVTENYIVTIPGTTTADIYKAEVTVTAPASITPALTYNRGPQTLVKAADVKPKDTTLTPPEFVVEYALSKDGPWDTNVPKGEDAGRYEVWYRVRESGNFSGVPAAMVVATIAPKTVSAPAITLDPNPSSDTSGYYIYDGSEKRPAVTVKDTDGEQTPEIPASEYTVTYSNNVNEGTATVTVTDRDGGNYTVNGTATFTITKASVGLTAPQPRTLTYNGELQNLVTPGAATGGQLVYALAKDGAGESKPAADAYSPTIPQGKNAGTYYVYYKVVGDSNHGDSAVGGPIEVSIGKNTVNTPTITLSADTFRYNGSQQIPTITVRDDHNLLIAEHEYKVEITGKDAKGEDIGNGSVDVGTYTIKITESENSNYIIKAGDAPADPKNVRTYKIVEADQETISITGMPNQVYYGDTIQLGVTGGTGNGTVIWEIKARSNGEAEADPEAETGTANTISEGGQLTIKEVGGPYIVTAKRTPTNENYNTISTTWEFSVSPKPVTAVLTGVSKTYDGKTDATVEARVDPGDLVGKDSLGEWSWTEYFEDANVGTNKIIPITASGEVKEGKYAVTYPETATADITPKQLITKVELTNKDASIVYDGTEQKPDVTVTFTDGDVPVTTVGDSDYTVAYSDNINAGTAAVTVRNVEGGNYIINAAETFTIEKANIAEAQVTAPTARSNTYNGEPQNLVTPGAATGGQLVYALGTATDTPADYAYSPTIPQGKNAGTYYVYYKVVGDSNHNNYIPTGYIEAAIAKKSTKITITLSSNKFRYNGSQQVPAITVRDDDNLVIADHEYTVEITGEKSNDLIAVDIYTIKITTPKTSNYEIKADESGEVHNTETYEIVAADQETLSITGMPNRVYYGDTIQLSTTGGTGNGTVTWEIKAKSNGETEADTEAETGTANTISEGGLLTIKEIGSFIVTATRTPTNGNYDMISATWEFSVSPKPVTAVLTGVSKTYDGKPDATVEARVDPDGLVSGDKIVIKDLEGTFDDPNVGTNKKITITTTTLLFDENDSVNWKNYTITCPETATADITPKEIRAEDITVTLNPGFFDAGTNMVKYTGSPLKPEVTGVTYDNGKVIAPKEYTVAYSDNINAGTAAVTVKNVDGGNYLINKSVTFVIVQADQEQFSIDEESGPIHYGDSFMLSTAGGSGDGEITWSVSGAATIDSNSGFVTVTDVDEVTVTATKAGGQNYLDATAAWTFTAGRRPIKAAVSAVNRPYNGGKDVTLKFEWVGVLVNGDKIDTSGVTGTIETPDAGEREVTISGEITDSKYDVEIQETPITVTISRANAVIETEPKANTGLVYVAGSQEPLVAAGASNFGEVIYYLVKDKTGEQGSELDEDLDDVVDLDILFENGTTSIPTVGDVPGPGTYEVQYGVRWSENWIGVGPNSVNVTIAGASDSDPSVGGGGDTTPGGDNYLDGDDDDSEDLGTPPANPGGEPGIEEPASMQTTVQNGASSTAVNGAAADRLADEAVANRSENVVIRPEIAGGVTKTEVSIPASAVGRIGNETDAALIISTPVADVTIPNAALDTLSNGGGTVSVVTERVENTVALTLSADGRDVGNISLTLTVPVEDAGPGTVAVLVREDGTRETIRWSVAEGGELRIPLDGSATVEIVDNSRNFADVSEENWAAGAVAFASAHELFNGTSETTFSPNLAMSRGMMATVLYNLEGRPEQELTNGFSDVESGVWYAAGVSWAAANGVVSGYGDGQFGPSDSVTREQLALMLWRYAGSPAVDARVLDFSDADQASGYAMEALYWAAAAGILKGYGDGRLDPSGLAARDQAAQIMKNFIESA